MRRGVRGLAMVLLLVGCDGVPVEVDPCTAPEGLGRPTSIDEGLDLIQALPDDADPSCFVRSLDRPLEVVATRSRVSAQPAAGRERPRLFLFFDDLVLSVVPEGVGADLVEFGERTPDGDSLKAEVQLPLRHDFAPADAYDRVLFEDWRTTCSFCHLGEREVDRVDGVPRFASEVLRPATLTGVDLDELVQTREACDDDDATCDLLRALLDHGPVVDGAFADGDRALQ